VFVRIGIHYPGPGREKQLLDLMHRFGEAQRSQPGLREVNALRDEKTGCLVGLAIWDSKEDWLAARDRVMPLVDGVDWDSLLDRPMVVYELEPM
jgi:heme-degrading monooxygenase HmoA